MHALLLPAFTWEEGLLAHIANTLATKPSPQSPKISLKKFIASFAISHLDCAHNTYTHTCKHMAVYIVYGAGH